MREALEAAKSWIERWASHVGNCRGGNECTCGRTAILAECAAALSSPAPDRLSEEERATIEIARTVATKLSETQDPPAMKMNVSLEASLLRVMEQECWTLRCVDIQTGGGDADVGWEVVSHHQAKPHDRVIASGCTPEEALRKAAHDVVRTEPQTAPDDDAAERLQRHGAHLFKKAKESGWKDDGGEGPYEFIVRAAFEAGTRCAAPDDAERLALAEADHLKRCTICGFVIDVSYKAEKPTADFTTRGRTKTKLAEEDEEETYQIGVRDGYESAIQDLDIATGGDGEFKGSTLPGGTVDVPAMKARIIERFQDLRAGGWREDVETARAALKEEER